MNHLHALIIDDEPMARELIERHCKAAGISVIGSCKNAVEAFQILHEQEPDVMFLDIQMPGITGLNFLRSLKKPPKVIFTTAYQEHAVDAFELEALDYLVKPITYERFLKAVQRLDAATSALQSIPQVTDPLLTSIFLKVNRRLVQVELADILFFESLGDYVKVFTTTAVLVCYSTLNKLTALLPEQQFQRVHRSYLIALKRIHFMEGNFIKIGDTDIPIGQTYKEALNKRLNLKTED
ncbi:LytR/AlgR family response regulator transcription factor [Pedobacter duraquae]|uniref:LytTR family two component transcriptional regulator n=1 Tax=Pedobacter duraquae TaxID=425511 RepID=A0A4R6INQ8_9SPHI|nr:LytTR family DNA-binding domain-containing protein [Pedobacter duraquae]TDO23899.1 LytTR family two component transcriptional regulator [Pedobacter duraquae]